LIFFITLVKVKFPSFDGINTKCGFIVLSEGLFTGTYYIKKIPSFSDRLKFRISVLFGVWKEGDHRDWNVIKTWTINLKSVLCKEH
jgi:hypothetical protein